ncbi:hypothetical protein [Paenibacillus kobensis]|uniref:hypothetical protein n=1 Tax=Paenibacillus kobensis TaxID=59841 RepID=UPI000FDC4265|nr:hypothetical protein [Paenibacillus kobensis]
MKSVTLVIKETLVYERDVQVEIPDDMDEKALNKALDSAQRGSDTIDDMVRKLDKQSGIKLTKPYDTDLSSLDSMEVECDEYDFVQ